MRIGHIRAALVVIAALVATSPGVAAEPPKPKLIVALSIDQFGADLYKRYKASFTGGLKRLGEGIVFTGYQSHAATETCPGHSTILTGDHPARTGIVANNWFDAKTGSNVYCVGVRGTADPDARGPQNLKVDTFGDWMKKVSPASQVVSISGKDRAAIMLGGHHADAVYWWNDGTGFTTSSFASPMTPTVLAAANSFDKALFAAWRAHPPQLWLADLPASCVVLAKPETFGKLPLSGKVPPEAAKDVESGPDFLARTDFQDQFRVSPGFDPMTVEFVKTLIDRRKLGQGPATDVLAVSLSTTDYIGHRYGTGGAEMCLQMAALDRAVGDLFAKLDSLGVPYVVVATADHGGSDAAERLTENGTPAKRVDPVAFVSALNKYLAKTLGLEAEAIVGDDPQQLIINVGPDEALRAKIRDATLAWLKDRPKVAQAYPAAETAAAVPPPGKPVTELTTLERFHESYDAERSGDIQVEFLDHTTLSMPRAAGDYVAGHGSPYDYDRRVPIFFWWPGVKGEARSEPVETVDIAPTLAGIAGVPIPAVDGKCLKVVAGQCG